MLSCSWTPVCGVPHSDSGAAVRLRFIAALMLSALVHALITAGVMSGIGAPGGHTSTTPVPAPLTVDLAPSLPEPPIASPEHEPEQRAAAPVSRPERKNSKRPEPAGSEPPQSGGDQPFAEIPDPTYYAARELDVYPALEAALELHYPAGAAASKTSGRVLLLVLIAATGVVDEASVVEAEPAGVFDRDALRALLAARFRPALRNGRAVKSRLLVDVTYGWGEKATP
jgi:protein TonB